MLVQLINFNYKHMGTNHIVVLLFLLWYTIYSWIFIIVFFYFVCVIILCLGNRYSETFYYYQIAHLSGFNAIWIQFTITIIKQKRILVLKLYERYTSDTLADQSTLFIPKKPIPWLFRLQIWIEKEYPTFRKPTNSAFQHSFLFIYFENSNAHLRGIIWINKKLQTPNFIHIRYYRSKSRLYRTFQ